MSAEPRVLLEFEAEYIGDAFPMRLVRYGEHWALEVLRDGNWDPHVSDNALDVARGIYESPATYHHFEDSPSDAMRAREVRE